MRSMLDLVSTTLPSQDAMHNNLSQNLESAGPDLGAVVLGHLVDLQVSVAPLAIEKNSHPA